MSEEITNIDVYAVTDYNDTEKRSAKFLYTIPSNKLIEIAGDATLLKEADCIAVVQPTKSWMLYRNFGKSSKVHQFYTTVKTVGSRGTNFLTDWAGKYDVEPPSLIVAS